MTEKAITLDEVERIAFIGSPSEQVVDTGSPHASNQSPSSTG
jgi:hypothetical protein